MKISQLVVLCGLAFASMPAFGGTIGPVCGSCQGSIYTLTYELVSLNVASIDTYNIFLTINTGTYNGGGLYIHEVAPKVASSTVLATLTSSPAGTWTTTEGGLNANGCSGSGTGFFCTAASGLGAAVSNITNSWSWTVSFATGTILDGDGEASLKVRYVNANNEKVGALMSEDLSLTGDNGVPEPGTFVMMGAGLAGVALLSRRFRK